MTFEIGDTVTHTEEYIECGPEDQPDYYTYYIYDVVVEVRPPEHVVLEKNGLFDFGWLRKVE